MGFQPYVTVLKQLILSAHKWWEEIFFLNCKAIPKIDKSVITLMIKYVDSEIYFNFQVNVNNLNYNPINAAFFDLKKLVFKKKN